MAWKNSLDRYLTSEPDSSFDYWADLAVDSMEQSFFDANEYWICEASPQCEKWLSDLYDKGKSPTEAAAIIERAHRRYINTETR